MECVNNSYVGAVNLEPFERLNEKINAMLGSHILYDTDVRDLVFIMEEAGLRNQWKEMNAKIRVELEAITKRVEEATKILDANPPEPEYRLVHHGAWTNYTWPNFNYCARNLVPAHERYTPVQPKQVRFALEKPALVSMPWAAWNCQVNTSVANANVKEIIPPKKQVIERRLFGEWDAMLEDVIEWHKRGLYRYNVRLGYPFVQPGFAYEVQAQSSKQ